MLEGTLIEAITCQLGAVDGLDIRFGDSVAVIGSGPAALIFLQLAQLKGAGFVGISLLPHPGRAELALSFGADTVIDSGRADDLTQHPQVRMSVGYDVVIDAVGSEETALAALRLARRGGKVLLYGLAQNELSRFPLGEVIFRNLTLYGRTSAPHMWEPAIALLARSALRLQPLISEVVSLEQAPELVTGRRHIPNVLKRVFKIKEDGMDAI
jgi:threonine dehydrogenase-like Zn-dependent dehydrogenase